MRLPFAAEALAEFEGSKGDGAKWMSFHVQILS